MLTDSSQWVWFLYGFKNSYLIPVIFKQIYLTFWSRCTSNSSELQSKSSHHWMQFCAIHHTPLFRGRVHHLQEIYWTYSKQEWLTVLNIACVHKCFYYCPGNSSNVNLVTLSKRYSRLADIRRNLIIVQTINYIPNCLKRLKKCGYRNCLDCFLMIWAVKLVGTIIYRCNRSLLEKHVYIFNYV